MRIDIAIYLFIVTAISFGMVRSMIPFVSLCQRGLYHYKCDGATGRDADVLDAGPGTCRAQEEMLEVVFDETNTFSNVGAIVTGLLLDFFDPKLGAVVASGVWAAGIGVMGINPNDGSWWIVGQLISGSASITILTANQAYLAFSVAPGNRRWHPVVRAFIVTGAQIGAAFPYLLLPLFRSESVSLFLVYLLVAVVCGLFFMVGISLLRPRDASGNVIEASKSGNEQAPLAGRIAASREVISTDVWLSCVFCATVLQVGGWLAMANLGSIARRFGADEPEVREARIYLMLILSATAVLNIFPGLWVYIRGPRFYFEFTGVRIAVTLAMCIMWIMAPFGLFGLTFSWVLFGFWRETEFEIIGLAYFHIFEGHPGAIFAYNAAHFLGGVFALFSAPWAMPSLQHSQTAMTVFFLLFGLCAILSDLHFATSCYRWYARVGQHSALAADCETRGDAKLGDESAALISK